MSGAERRLLRGTGPDLGPIATRLPEDQRSLLHVLELQAQQRPDHPWAVVDGTAVTYAQARTAAHRFADALARERLHEPHVALLMRNHEQFLPVFLGAQYAAGVAVPLNPELQGPLLARMLAVCRATVLVVHADLAERLVTLESLSDVRLVLVCGTGSEALPSLPGVMVARLAEWLAGAEPREPRKLPRPWDVGALVFTSGTSGGSKAAVWTHQYMHLTSACMCDTMQHTEHDVLSTPLQMCHIAGLQVFAFAALQLGATTHLKSRFSARHWWEQIARDGATFSMLMGQMAAMILAEVETAPAHRLRRVYILPRPAERVEFERRYGTTVLWQGWGMTEIFPHTPRRDPLAGVPDDTIGPAPAWVDWGVVDEHDRLCAPGELGELVYRPLIADGMASGYFEDAAATAAAFRNFMFHTGDLGYYDEHQLMHFVMRNQDAIRRRGENVSAVELEAVALRHPAVLEAAAFAIPAAMGEHEVKLDLVLGWPETLADLHDWLVTQLPRFMVPTYLEQRESLPKTVSQRVEKYKLAEQGVDRPEVAVFPARRRPSRAEQARIANN